MEIMVADLNLVGSLGDLYCFSNTLNMLVIPHVNFQQSDWSNDWVTIFIIIPRVNFQKSDWSIGLVTILNVTRQYLTAMKFVVEMGHFQYNKINITFFTG